MVGTVGGWVLGVCVWSHGGGWSVGYVLSPFPFLLMHLLSPITTNFPPSGLRKTLLQLPYIPGYLPSFALGCHGRIITRKGRIQRHSGIWASSTRRHTRLLLAIYDQALLIFASVTHSVRIKDLFDLTRTWVGSPRHLLAVPTTMRKGSGIYLLFLS